VVARVNIQIVIKTSKEDLNAEEERHIRFSEDEKRG
jgi:hypothetical protein